MARNLGASARSAHAAKTKTPRGVNLFSTARSDSRRLDGAVASFRGDPLHALRNGFIPMKTFLFRFASAALLLALVSLPLRAQLVDFDDLPPSWGEWLPDPYAGLWWGNFQYLTGDTLPYSGFSAGTVSSPNVGYNAYGLDAAFWSEDRFDLTSLYLTAGWMDGLEVRIQGFRDGDAVYDRTEVLNTATPAFLLLQWYDLEAVLFTPSGGTSEPNQAGWGTHFAIDDILFNANPPIPEPSTWGLAGASALAALVFLRRLRAHPSRVS